MIRLRVLICRIARGLWERCEVGTWLADSYCRLAAGRLPAVSHILHGIMDGEPTPCPRNAAVMAMRQTEADVLVMVDNDMEPAPDFLGHATQFLASRPGAVAIGSPYCAAAPERLVQVTRMVNGVPVRVPRQLARLAVGDELVGGIGTGFVAIRRECFDLVPAPWFEYEYADSFQTGLKTTEDNVFFRKLTSLGGRLYCAWDHWSGHHKSERVGKPEPERV